MKKIIFLLILFSWLKSEAQNVTYGPKFQLLRHHRYGAFGTSTTDTIYYADSLRVKTFKPLLPGSYTTEGAPTASGFPGYIIYNTDSSKPQYSNGTNWLNLPGTSGGGGGGSYTFNTPLSEAATVVSIANAAADGSTKGAAAFTAADFIDASGVISIDYANGQMASASVNGFMSTTTQTIAGTKTWSGASAIFGTTGANANLSLRRTSDGVEVGVIGVSTNPFINTITGTLNLQSGGTTRLNLSTNGVFIGALSSPAGARLEIAAGGTAANSAPIKFNSGSLLTTPVVGAFEFLTDKFYGTITTGTARKEFTMNDAALTSGRIPYATTNGRLTDNAGVLYDGTNMSLGTTSAKLTLFSLWSSGDATIISDDQVNIIGGLVVSRAIAGDADFTATTAMQTIMLPQISADRALTLPTPANGQIYIIHNENSAGFAWNITGTLQDKANAAVTSLTNDTVYIIQGISNTHWKIVSIY